MTPGYVCTWCLAALTLPSSQLRIDVRQDDLDPDEDAAAWWTDQHNGSLARKAELIEQAIGRGWNVSINGWHRAGQPVATWHGDPICEPHLSEAAQREREPRMVRMAQWRH